MKREEFLKAMAMLVAGYRNLDMNAAELDVWYEFFADINGDMMMDAVRSWIRGSKYPPTIHELLDKCEDQKQVFRNGTLTLMWNEGLFHCYSTLELEYGPAPEWKALMRYENAQRWVERPAMMPDWFKADYEHYKRKYYQMRIGGGGELVRLPYVHPESLGVIDVG